MVKDVTDEKHPCINYDGEDANLLREIAREAGVPRTQVQPGYWTNHNGGEPYYMPAQVTDWKPTPDTSMYFRDGFGMRRRIPRAEINWCAKGSQPPTVARSFAAGLTYAAQVAETWNKLREERQTEYLEAREKIEQAGPSPEAVERLRA